MELSGAVFKGAIRRHFHDESLSESTVVRRLFAPAAQGARVDDDQILAC